MTARPNILIVMVDQARRWVVYPTLRTRGNSSRSRRLPNATYATTWT